MLEGKNCVISRKCEKMRAMGTSRALGPIVILGAGYTGRFLETALSGQGRIVLFTSRDPGHRLAHVPPAQRLRFDLTEPSTWANIPPSADLIWCFPAAPLDLVQQFAAVVNAPGRIVVLGSTSAYDIGEPTGYPPPWINETAPVDLSKPRVEGEEYLRKTLGAIVLRVAGIYGPGRNPLDWIRQGRVGPSRKFVNLIHANDLASVCAAALERGVPGAVYNVSDGTPRTWDDIVRYAGQRWGITQATRAASTGVGKRIETRKLQQELGVSLRHGDLFAELEVIERVPVTSAGELVRPDRPAGY